MLVEFRVTNACVDRHPRNHQHGHRATNFQAFHLFSPAEQNFIAADHLINDVAPQFSGERIHAFFNSIEAFHSQKNAGDIRRRAAETAADGDSLFYVQIHAVGIKPLHKRARRLNGVVFFRRHAGAETVLGKLNFLVVPLDKGNSVNQAD